MNMENSFYLVFRHAVECVAEMIRDTVNFCVVGIALVICDYRDFFCPAFVVIDNFRSAGSECYRENKREKRLSLFFIQKKGSAEDKKQRADAD